ncbi:hypothetical protein J7295_02217 [Nakaseomyces glabratus]|nr:hypothetical protein J7295_02217 [Nakaseomyces glabratus]
MSCRCPSTLENQPLWHNFKLIGRPSHRLYLLPLLCVCLSLLLHPSYGPSFPACEQGRKKARKKKFRTLVNYSLSLGQADNAIYIEHIDLILGKYSGAGTYTLKLLPPPERREFVLFLSEERFVGYSASASYL